MYHLIAKIYNITFIVIIVVLSVLFSARLSSAENEMVKIGYSGVSEELFQTYIVIEGLKKMGYHVPDPVSLTLTNLYENIESGKIDLTAIFWDPLGRPFLKAHHTKNPNTVVVGTYIQGAKSGYLIDKKTAEQHNITSLKDLQKPEIAALFDHNQNKKADLTGCELGWGCATMIKAHIDELGLEESVEFLPGLFFAQISEIVAKHDANQPVLFYSWTPMWVTGLLQPNRDVIWLEANDVKGFGENTIRFLCSKTFLEAHPDIHYFLDHISLSVNDVAEQNFLMRKGQDSIRQIKSHAQEWIENHQEIFNAALVKPAI